MKDLLISVCCMLLLLVPWEIYSSYTAGTMHFCSDAIDAKVLPAVTQNDWENAKKGSRKFQINGIITKNSCLLPEHRSSTK